MFHHRWLLLLLAGVVSFALTPSVDAEFPLKDGDVWVMAGDSITAQHLHSNYFEAFCFARYPQQRFAFRNSGVGGHTIPTTLARFDYDIAAWKPTIVSVELGMNDKGSTATDQFIANMGTMVERIRSISARPVILAASPVNDGSLLTQLSGGNQRLHEYADALKDFAAKRDLPYADQFHALIDHWGQNKPRENLANALPGLTILARDEQLAGVEHLRAFLAAQSMGARKLVSMQGDPVHPGPNGQLMMAAVLLQRLGADGFVSSATLDAAGTVLESKGCQVESEKSGAGAITFTRLDERLPFPLPDGTLDVVGMLPAVNELSQYTLTVRGLKAGRYSLRINGISLPGALTEQNWSDGVNLTSLVHSQETSSSAPNPVLAQSRAILQAVSAKEGLVSQWRGLSQRAFAPNAAADLKDQLAALTAKVEEADQKIREAARPQKLRCELVLAP